jgi:hypothetical protein
MKKNIYILSTNQPSRLVKVYMDAAREYFTIILDAVVNDDYKQYVNLCITSDEKFKENEWVISNGEMTKASPKMVNSQGLLNRKAWEKVILTTDPTLIKDGVQAIDDEFLEWFVKNPTYELVEVKISHSYFKSEKDILTPYYKIIIPQEKHKNLNNQEIMFHEEHKEYFYEDFIDGKFVTVWLGKDYIPQEEHKQLNLQQLEAKLDDALAKETKESLTNWLYKKEIKKCVGEIIDELYDRVGFTNWWDNLNQEIEIEIIESLEDIVEKRFNKIQNRK